jgi:hypothetical protein
VTASIPASDATQEVTWEDYARAARFLPWNIKDAVFDGHVAPHWIVDSARFWYHVRRPSGTEFVLVDAERDQREPAFDHVMHHLGLSSASAVRD